MATDNIRAYFVLDAGATRTLVQWSNLRTQWLTKATPQALVAYYNSHAGKIWTNISNARLSIGTNVRRYAVLKFEADVNDVDAFQAFIDVQCGIRNIVQATYRLKLQALLQAELRESGTDLGFSVAITNTFVVTIVGFGNRDQASSDANAWIHDVSRVADWEPATV
jgi:hypothetical protein